MHGGINRWLRRPPFAKRGHPASNHGMAFCLLWPWSPWLVPIAVLIVVVGTFESACLPKRIAPRVQESLGGGLEATDLQFRQQCRRSQYSSCPTLIKVLHLATRWGVSMSLLEQ